MNYVARRRIWSRIRQPIWGAACLAALLVVLGGCSLGGGSSSPSQTNEAALTQIPWCDSVSINFVDSSSVNQDSITSWSAVSTQLGFTPYLPMTFPKGTCLVLAAGSIHDPIFGGHFDITWNLPGNVPMSFSEAPKRAGLASSLQCAGSTQQSKTEICLGTVGNTGITIASTESAGAIQTLFHALAPNVDWMPSGTNQQQATPSPTG